MVANKRFGRIEFAIGCEVTRSFKDAVAEIADTDWHPLFKTFGNKRIETVTEWAEVCFVPNEIGRSKNGPGYRFIAKRQVPVEQESLPGMEDP